MISSHALSLSLASAFSGAISALLAKYVLRFADTRRYLSLNFGVIFVALLPFTPFFFKLRFTGDALLLLLAAAVIDGVANYFYFKAFEMADAGAASTLLSLAPLFTLALAPLATHFTAALTLWNTIGVVSSVAGVIVLNREMQRRPSAPPLPRTRMRSQLAAPLIASALFGGNVYLTKHILAAEIANPFTYYLIRALVIAVLSYILWRPDLTWATPRALAVTAGRAIFVIGQWLTFLYALELGNPALVKAASEITPLFVVGLSALFLGEKIGRHKTIGVILIVGGVWLITA